MPSTPVKILHWIYNLLIIQSSGIQCPMQPRLPTPWASSSSPLPTLTLVHPPRPSSYFQVLQLYTSPFSSWNIIPPDVHQSLPLHITQIFLLKCSFLREDVRECTSQICTANHNHPQLHFLILFHFFTVLSIIWNYIILIITATNPIFPYRFVKKWIYLPIYLCILCLPIRM